MSTKNLKRCGWCGTDPLYVAYHDNEWGREVYDDQTMFEFLVLESAQAGLSWITILRKRENYRKGNADVGVKYRLKDDDPHEHHHILAFRSEEWEEKSLTFTTPDELFGCTFFMWKGNTLTLHFLSTI